jgi:uncharacterized protein YegJ (DUF2314 family)
MDLDAAVRLEFGYTWIMLSRVALIVVVVTLAACSKKTPRGEEGNIQVVASDDTDMNAAIASAKSSTPQFMEALRHPSATFHDFSVKVPYPTGTNNGREHLWISEVTEVGDHLEGNVANEPVDTTLVKFRQHVSVKPTDLSDWKYVDGKKLIGGYTIRYQLSKMSAKDRQAILEEAGFTLE